LGKARTALMPAPYLTIVGVIPVAFFVAILRLRMKFGSRRLLIKFRQAYPCPLERVKAIVMSA